jgi:hypothetical protein
MKTTELILLGAVGVLGYMLWKDKHKKSASAVMIAQASTPPTPVDGSCYNQTVLNNLPADPAQLYKSPSAVNPISGMAQTMMGNSTFGASFFQPTDSKFN